jgi:hypothetical protein
MSININILSNFNGSGFNRLEKELKRLNTPIEKIGAVSRSLAPAAVIGLTAMTAMGAGAIRAAEDAQVADNRLSNVAQSMGVFGKETDTVVARLKSFADQVMKTTAVDDELVKSTQAQLLTFKNLAVTAGTTGGALDRATLAAIDMAAVFGGDGSSNAVKLGKALQDPVKGVTALTRVGITFTDKEKEKIATLVDSNKMLEAQDFILSAIEQQVGGTAEATATGTAKMNVAFGEMQEQIGAALLPLFEQLVPLVTGFFEWIGKNSGVVSVLAGIFAALAVSILAVNFALNANPIVKVITLIAALATGVVLLIDYLVNLYGGWDKLFKDLGKWLSGFGELFQSVWNGITTFFTNVVNGYINIWQGFINTIIGGLNGIIDLANSALSLISAATGGAINIKIPTIGNVQLPKIPTKGGKKIPKLADGGIVMPRPGGVLANLAEAGEPEAVIPLSRLENNRPSVVYNINVNGGVGSGATIGKSIVDAIKAYERTSGAVWQGA